MTRPRLYKQLVESLLAFVSQENVLPGQQLPTERELAKRLGVSRASVAQAVVALEVQGILGVRQGDGIYLLRHADPQESVEELIKRRQRLPDIIEAREALEVKIAALAAQRRTEEDLAAIDAALADMEHQITAGEHGYDGDQAFHAAITDAAHNPVLSGLMKLLAGPIEESRRESLAQPGRPRRSLASHHRIAEAVRAGVPARAARAARDHVALVSKVTPLNNGERESGG
ncbi:MAG TPA: FCD domain-containing protein [Mycobacteriales bacterium]|nr:FCD domain-containing protein [Mycobacteriales bacterium]